MINNKKQSSVDCFIEQLEEKGGAWENLSLRTIQISIDVSDYLELKRNAKEMHKEEQKKAYNAKLNNWYFDFEHYYNETFNNNDTP